MTTILHPLPPARAAQARPDADPAWYRGLRFVCIWACLAFVTANAALLLTRVAPGPAPAAAQASQPERASASASPRATESEDARAAPPQRAGFL